MKHYVTLVILHDIKKEEGIVEDSNYSILIKEDQIKEGMENIIGVDIFIACYNMLLNNAHNYLSESFSREDHHVKLTIVNEEGNPINNTQTLIVHSKHIQDCPETLKSFYDITIKLIENNGN
jgi:hypothetical protein